MRRRQASKAEQQQEAQAQQAPPAPAPAAAPSADPVAELERLGQLRQQGLLTDEEFAAAKAKLLS